MTPPVRLYFWRTVAGAEVDFVVEHGRRVLAVEVKRTDRPSDGDAGGLRRFLAEHPQAAGGLLHAGQEIRRLSEAIVAVPWTLITG
jgi:predicted AAA+ superfamily ATPase